MADNGWNIPEARSVASKFIFHFPLSICHFPSRTGNAKGTPVSLLTSETGELRFLARFEDIWESLRRFQVRQGLCWTFLAAAVGLGLLVVADYGLELSWSIRAAW